MATKIGMAELKMVKEDGSLLSRIEMEKQLREESVHHRRLRASKLGLSTKIAQHMLPISVTHWILDHWVQNGTITGEILGVRSEFDADDNKDYLRQLTQRLVLFIEHKLAMVPNPGEGIDMSNVNLPPGFPPMPPSPPSPPNGQHGAPAFAPPPPPQMPGMPPGPMMAPQPPQPPMPFPGGGPVPQQGFTPPGFPQQNFGPPSPPAPPVPQQQGFPPMMAPPIQQQQMAPQPQQGAAQPPTKADPNRQWGQAGKRENGEQRTRRTKEELAEDAAYEAWTKAGGATIAPQQPQQVAPQPQTQVAPQPQPVIGPPNPFGNMGTPPGVPAIPGLPPMPNLTQPSIQATTPTQVQAPQPSITAEQFADLQKQVKMLSMGIAMLLRVAYQKQGSADLYEVLTAVCGLNP